MTWERMFVRITISVLCVLVSVALFPFLMVMKELEGVWLAAKVTKDSIAQVWAARGLPGLDKK